MSRTLQILLAVGAISTLLSGCYSSTSTTTRVEGHTAHTTVSTGYVSHEVWYEDPHPVHAVDQHTSDWCYIEGAHTHHYEPEHTEFYVLSDGYYVFVGDPTYYVHDTSYVEVYSYHGHHPVYFGHHWCYIVGPHYHHWSPRHYGHYAWVDHHWYYHGHYDHHYHHNRTYHVDRYYKKHRPRRVAHRGEKGRGTVTPSKGSGTVTASRPDSDGSGTVSAPRPGSGDSKGTSSGGGTLRAESPGSTAGTASAGTTPSSRGSRAADLSGKGVSHTGSKPSVAAKDPGQDSGTGDGTSRSAGRVASKGANGPAVKPPVTSRTGVPGDDLVGNKSGNKNPRAIPGLDPDSGKKNAPTWRTLDKSPELARPADPPSDGGTASGNKGSSKISKEDQRKNLKRSSPELKKNGSRADVVDAAEPDNPRAGGQAGGRSANVRGGKVNSWGTTRKAGTNSRSAGERNRVTVKPATSGNVESYNLGKANRARSKARRSNSSVERSDLPVTRTRTTPTRRDASKTRNNTRTKTRNNTTKADRVIKLDKKPKADSSRSRTRRAKEDRTRRSSADRSSADSRKRRAATRSKAAKRARSNHARTSNRSSKSRIKVNNVRRGSSVRSSSRSKSKAKSKKKKKSKAKSKGKARRSKGKSRSRGKSRRR